MNSNKLPKLILTEPVAAQPSVVERQWQAWLRLIIAKREQRTSLLATEHFGPLRVQRPFYPETNGCCHIYLLHPPGGMVIGDRLRIEAQLNESANALLTTPSAGKLYGAGGSHLRQQQTVQFSIGDAACLEWLPQETIIFDGANGELQTKINLTGSANVFAWDIIRLGRAASGERFTSGNCRQTIEICHDGYPVFIERNNYSAQSLLMKAKWGLQGANTVGTLFASIMVERDQIDDLLLRLQQFDCNSKSKMANMWGLTQKDSIFIARYLGDSVSCCRDGFEFIWQYLRPVLNGSVACKPRIWNT